MLAAPSEASYQLADLNGGLFATKLYVVIIIQSNKDQMLEAERTYVVKYRLEKYLFLSL